MISAGRLAWLQLRRQKVRLVVALTGVAFAVVLMLMQVGFRDALFMSALNLHRRLRADLVMVSPQYNVLTVAGSFPRRRLYQALAFPGVASTTPLYASNVLWKDPVGPGKRKIFLVGFDPAQDPIDVPGISAHRSDVREADVVLFDERSRPEYGPMAAAVAAGDTVTTEIAGRRVTVRATFALGTSFSIDGSVVTSDLNYLRIIPTQSLGAVSVGLVNLVPGADPQAVRRALVSSLPRDVVVLTRQEYMDREVSYWASTTPIGYVFNLGVVMGLIVGAIIVYQILFAGITDHLAEYATLKAMGFTNGYLARVVLMQALILAVAGFVPGVGVVSWLYGLTESMTKLPMALTVTRCAFIFAATVVLCGGSALIAMRKLRAADPAEVF